MVDAYYDVIVRFKDIEDPKKTFRKLTLEGNDPKYGGFISKINDTSNPSRSNAVDVDKLNNLISDYYKTDDKYRLDVPKNSSAYILYSYDEEDFETITIRNIGVEYYNSVGGFSFFTWALVTFSYEVTGTGQNIRNLSEQAYLLGPEEKREYVCENTKKRSNVL